MKIIFMKTATRYSLHTLYTAFTNQIGKEKDLILIKICMAKFSKMLWKKKQFLENKSKSGLLASFLLYPTKSSMFKKFY